MSDTNIVVATFHADHNRITMTRSLHQWDRNQVLRIVGAEALPQTFEAHFSNVKHGGITQTVVGIDGEVDIPTNLLMTGKRIYCWIYVTDGSSAQTEYLIVIPVEWRPMPEYYDVEDTGVFDEVVAQVAEYAATATTGATSATASATAAAGSETAAAASASAAADSAENAAASEANAEASASAAQASDASAATAAATATTKAAEAAQSATSAGSAADRAEAAQEAAETAQTAAGNAASGAGQAAGAAGQYATSAGQSASRAETAASTAEGKASEATFAAGQAVEAETEAISAKNAAQVAESNATNAATTATAKATEAAASATAAAQSAASINTPDSALSDTSTNAVQNKVITGELTDVKTAIDALDATVNGEKTQIQFVQTGAGNIYLNNNLPVLNYSAGATGNNQIMVINNLSDYGLSAGDKITATLAYNTVTTYFGIAFHTSSIGNGSTPLTSGIAFAAEQTVQKLTAIIPDGTVSIVFYNRLPLNANPKVFKVGTGIVDEIDAEINQLASDVDDVRAEIDLKSNRIGREISDDVYAIGDTFVNQIGLHASNNAMLNFIGLTHNGEPFKNVGDDIAPILLVGAGYVGANHGYNFAYQCTATGHGLTVSDIGKTFSDGTNTWVLIKVISADVFQIVCYDGTKWYKAKTETVPGTVNFGSSITISASSLTQIYPSIKNGAVRVAENTATVFRVIESYDVIDLGTALDALIANVGGNTNGSLVELADAVMTLNTVYEFNGSGAVTLYQRLTKHKGVKLDSYYGSQCMAFAASDLIAALGSTFPVLQDAISSAEKSNWSDPSVAPSVFIKSDSTKDRLFVIAYTINRTSNLKTTAGYVNASSKKLYPNMVQPYNEDVGAYQNIVLRLPVSKIASGAEYTSYANVGNDVYVFIGTLTAKTVDVMVDGSIYGKNVEVVASNNITVNTQTVTSSINITSTGEGYALLKVS